MLCPAVEGGSGFYRMDEPYRVLTDRYDVVRDLKASSIRCQLNHEGSVTAVDPLECDVVVFQVPMSRRSPEMIRAVKAQGIKVVVELDDDFWNLDKRAWTWPRHQPSTSPESNWRHLDSSLREADLVTVTTPALAKLVLERGAKRSVVLRNRIPEWYLGVKGLPDNPREVLGSRLSVLWTGSPDTHINDLSVCGSGVREAVRGANGAFVCIGTESSGPLLGFDDAEALYSPAVLLEDYPAAVEPFDIGIVPLRITAFNQAKSWLKGIEYAALGLPFVASSTEEYLRLSKHAGLIAEQKHDWQRQLKRLLTSESLRDEERLRGLEFSRTNTYEVHAQEWWDAWASA